LKLPVITLTGTPEQRRVKLAEVADHIGFNWKFIC
jgi:hypothetical protein